MGKAGRFTGSCVQRLATRTVPSTCLGLLTGWPEWLMLLVVKARELLKVLRNLGCEEVRQRGLASPFEMRGVCDDGRHACRNRHSEGTLKKIERDLTPCLGKDWLQRG